MTDSFVANAWYNFKTQDYDWLNSPPKTDEQAVNYLPQIEPVQMIYKIRRELGDDILRALAYALEAYVKPR